MTKRSASPGPSLEGRDKPFQFTVRAYFGLAVLVSLVLAAVDLLEGSPSWTAVGVLAWLILGGLYIALGARRPLWALGVGPVAVTSGWCLLAGSGQVTGPGNTPLGLAERLPGCALGWGALLSVLVVLCGRPLLGGRRPVGHGAGRAGPVGPNRVGSSGAGSASGLACRMALARMALALPLLLAAWWFGSSGRLAGVWAVCLLDAPLAPVYLAQALRPGFSPVAPGGPAVAFFLVTAICGGAVCAVAGLGLGWLASGPLPSPVSGQEGGGPIRWMGDVCLRVRSRDRIT